MLFVFYTTCSGEEICYSISTETIDSHLTATPAIQLSFQVLYNLPVASRQEQKTANLCPFLLLRTCLHHRIWWRSCSKAPTFATLSIGEWRTRQWLALYVQSVIWRVQLHTKKCSHDLVFWTIYYNWPHVFFCQWGTSLQWSASVYNLIAVGAVG